MIGGEQDGSNMKLMVIIYQIMTHRHTYMWINMQECQLSYNENINKLTSVVLHIISYRFSVNMGKYVGRPWMFLVAIQTLRSFNMFNDRLETWLCAGRKVLTDEPHTWYAGLSCLLLSCPHPSALRHDSQGPGKGGHATLSLVHLCPVHGVLPRVALQDSAKEKCIKRVMTPLA